MSQSKNKFLPLLQEEISLDNIGNKELDDIIKEACYHELHCALYNNLNKGKTSKFSLHNRLRNTYILNIGKNLSAKHEFEKINKAFAASSIKTIPIKGMSLLYDIYPDLESRCLVDIDLLVKKENLYKSRNILFSLGYKETLYPFSESYYLKNHCHLPFKNKLIVELHWALAKPTPYVIRLPCLWERLTNIKSDRNDISFLSPEDTIFSLVLHLRRFNKPFSLKYVYDIHKIIEKYKEKLDWKYLAEYSRLNRLNSVMYYMLFYVKTMFGQPISSKTLNMFYPGILRAALLKFSIRKVKNKGVLILIKHPCLKKLTYTFLRYLFYDRLTDFINFIILMPGKELNSFCNIRFPYKKI